MLTRDIVGIFDLDSTTVSDTTKDFLRKCEKEGLTDTATVDIPRSFILTAENQDMYKIQFSQISSLTLSSRINSRQINANALPLILKGYND